MKFLFCLTILLTTIFAYGQRKSDHLFIQGSILGYKYNPKTTLFSKNQVDIEGSLTGVKVQLKENSKVVISKTTNKSGEFSMFVPIGKIYQLTYSKNGYGTSTIDLNLNNIPKDIASSGLHLSNIELLLNSFNSEKPADNGTSYGCIRFDNGNKKFVFDPVEFDRKEALYKKLEDNAPVNILKNALRKNDKNNQEFIDAPEKKSTESNALGDTASPDLISTSTTSIEELIAGKPVYEAIVKSKLNEISKWGDLTKEDLSNRATEIEKALTQLELDKKSAVTETDFLVLEIREQQLLSAQNQLKAAELYIDEQAAKLEAKSLLNYALIGIIIIIAILALVLLKRNKEKATANRELALKNKKITDSINYAERIQRSVLLAPQQIKEILPDSFIYHEPLNIVSGDFYWISRIDNNIIFAAIDCTGHGVPGAFMSMIANTLMNKFINEQKITDPGKILTLLHEGIIDSLHQKEDEYLSQDGMDMSICTINANTNQLKFAGAMNGGYILRDGTIHDLQASIHGVGGYIKRKKERAVHFDVTEFDLLKNDMIYLFSDGYMDQFGGNSGEKYNVSRFKELLTSIADQPTSEQKKKVASEFKNWRGNNAQIDDVLLMGVRI